MAFKRFTGPSNFARSLAQTTRSALGWVFGSRRKPLLGPINATEKKSRFSVFGTWFQDSWALEYLCVGFSVACLIAMLATLFHFDGALLTSWHSELSINTILSVLGTGMKSAALLATASALGQLKWTWFSNSNRPLQDFETFDNASRGPYGALTLLKRVPYSNLACIGALVTIMSLASDAFVQASTSQPLKSVSNLGATVPVGHQYMFETPISTVDPLLKIAMYSGVFNTQVNLNQEFQPNSYATTPFNTSSEISPICATGNCTFPPYVSLAVRHECDNITETLSPGNGSNSVNQTVYLQIPSYGQYLTALYLELYINNSQATLVTELNMTTGDITKIDHIANPSNGSISTDGLNIGDIYMVKVDPDTVGINGINHFQAFRCNLHFGMQVYTATVDKGVFSEKPSEFIPGNWTFFRQNGENNSFWFWEMKAEVSGTERQLKVGYYAREELAVYLPTIFTGGMTNGQFAYTYSEIFQSVLLSTSIQDGSMGSDTLFGNVAQSLTAYFRTATNNTADGWTQELVPYIDARWWFTLWPIVMVVLNSAFVIATSIQSRCRGIPSWRGSALAYILTDHATVRDGSTDGVTEAVVIGPPEGFDRNSELEEWASCRKATLRQRAKKAEG